MFERKILKREMEVDMTLWVRADNQPLLRTVRLRLGIDKGDTQLHLNSYLYESRPQSLSSDKTHACKILQLSPTSHKLYNSNQNNGKQ